MRPSLKPSPPLDLKMDEMTSSALLDLLKTDLSVDDTAKIVDELIRRHNMGMKQVHDVDGNALPTDPHLSPLTHEPKDMALVETSVEPLPGGPPPRPEAPIAHPLDPTAD